MKKILAVFGVLLVLTLGFATLSRTPKTETTKTQTSTPTSAPEVSEAVPASAGSVAEQVPVAPETNSRRIRVQFQSVIK